jgi:hypothetical protein
MNNIHAAELRDADTHALLDDYFLYVQMKQEKVCTSTLDVRRKEQ